MALKISDATHYKGVEFPKGTFIGSPCCNWTYSLRKGSEVVFDPFGREKVYQCDECKKRYSLFEIENHRKNISSFVNDVSQGMGGV